jgi:hypothetical protein
LGSGIASVLFDAFHLWSLVITKLSTWQHRTSKGSILIQWLVEGSIYRLFDG